MKRFFPRPRFGCVLYTTQQWRFVQSEGEGVEKGGEVPSAAATVKKEAPEDAEGSTEDSPSVKKVPPIISSKWQKLPLFPWRQSPANFGIVKTQQKEGERNFRNDPFHYIFGESLGPRPLIVLPGILQTEEKDIPHGEGITTPFDHILHHLIDHKLYQHGALMAPSSVILPIQSEADSQSNNARNAHWTMLLDQQCHQLAAMLEHYHIHWTHFFSYSSGTLLAARFSYLYPERMGSWMVVDTPLLTSRLLTNEKHRIEIQKALRDPYNIPMDVLMYHLAKLQGASPDEDLKEPYFYGQPASEDAPSLLQRYQELNKLVYEQHFGTHTYPLWEQEEGRKGEEGRIKSDFTAFVEKYKNKIQQQTEKTGGENNMMMTKKQKKKQEEENALLKDVEKYLCRDFYKSGFMSFEHITHIYNPLMLITSTPQTTATNASPSSSSGKKNESNNNSKKQKQKSTSDDDVENGRSSGVSPVVLSEVATIKEHMNLRKHASIKSAKCHQDLLSYSTFYKEEDSANDDENDQVKEKKKIEKLVGDEVATQILNFVHRFEMDVLNQKRVEGLKKDLEKATHEGVTATADVTMAKGKKKEKKVKKPKTKA